MQTSTVTLRKTDRPVFEWSFFGHFLCPDFEIRTDFFLTSSLDRFVMNKIFLMTLFYMKRSRLALQKPYFFVRFLNGPDIKCQGLA
jgi:hypothetical protein